MANYSNLVYQYDMMYMQVNAVKYEETFNRWFYESILYCDEYLGSQNIDWRVEPIFEDSFQLFP